ncbi:two-component sensor histidine kinase [Rhodobacteraceae bacterium 2CG4]|uniref:histidine kinase n=1 Tax=Halovulum marinum TaxID=2662447 RepID=A0A6L5Z5L1_9RHOB|nr:histidine kinase [Halovulum marinum]MSU91375.1 two-component sensor histidine kinase [Halovulum marinum]
MVPTVRLAEPWRGMPLAARFALAGGVVLTLAALAVGAVVTDRIERSVVRNTARTTAEYMDAFISPISQQLAVHETLSPGARRALDEVFTGTPLADRIVSYKIWRPDGQVIQASDPDLIGRRFAPSAGLQRAATGEVVGEFEQLDGEAEAEAALGLPLLEIYSPIREVWSGEVIAVAEFYEVNERLKADLATARLMTWLTVAAVGAGLGGVLYLIVLGGSRTIEAQRRDLDVRLRELRTLSARNLQLARRVRHAAGRAAAGTEQSLRRIGADLHDGPAQYLAFAALRLDDLREALPDAAARDELDGVKDAIDRAMAEVREISRGLILPDIAGLPPGRIAAMAVEAHRSRTGETVRTRCDCAEAPEIGQAARICLYRFVQEGLNNASRHAGGGSTVTLSCGDGVLSLTVADTGPGFGSEPRYGMGLTGLRDRVESLGGQFAVATLPDGGGAIRMTLEPGVS